MKKIYLLFAISAMVITYLSCMKEPQSKDPLVTRMARDADVQAYFALISDQLKQISAPYTKDLLNPNRVKPTKADFEAEAKKVVSTHLDETKHIMELGLTIRNRYDLGKKSESDVRGLFDKIQDEFAKSPRKHTVSRRDPNDATSVEHENYGQYARYQQQPETTKCVQYYLITYYTDDPSNILTASPLFLSCTEVYTPTQTGSVSNPYNNPNNGNSAVDPDDSSGLVKKLKYCQDDMTTRILRCDRNSEVAGGLITTGFLLGGLAAVLFTDGAAIKYTPQAITAYAAAMAGVAATCYLCKQDARDDFYTCKMRAYN